MKKSIFFLAAAFWALTSMAESVKVGDLYYERNYTYNTASVTCQNWSDNYAGIKSIDIPNQIEYNGMIYKVTSIGKEAFKCCSSLVSVTIPEGREISVKYGGGPLRAWLVAIKCSMRFRMARFVRRFPFAATVRKLIHSQNTELLD